MKPTTLAATLVLLLVTAPGLAARQTSDRFGDLRARAIGPAGMSGRVAAVDVALKDRNVIFVGGATGGLFRSRDGGLTWDPVFDDQPALGIGAVAVFQANPDIVWAGTGEGNPRNSAGVGRGLFKSLDGGDTWERVGLEASERIHRIVPHPFDPDVVYVAALGPAWSDGGERGVYRTRDGGDSWERVLFRNERTGAADLVMDPSNPDKLFAAMWEYHRDPWFFTSGGPGSGLFVTHDGGDSWDPIEAADGIPAGELGRIGLAVSPSSPEVVYALVEASKSALVRSDDGGRSWRTISDRDGIAPRPFYYADLRVDPKNENRIYSLHSAIQVSEDQGRSWRTVVPSQVIHGDVHELWIDPDDPRRMIIGEDGGIAFTYDRGEHWRFVENLALAQFYHVTADMEIPFNVYGGLQDNGSWYGPSDVWEGRGILNAHWRRVGGGDGFSVMSDPSDPRFGYSMSQQGSLQRFDKVTGGRVGIQPVHPDGVPLRFNWNAGLVVDPHDATTVYLGSQFVHRTRDHGASWEIISPDLTTDDPEKQRQMQSGGLTLDATGAENHTTIVTIAPSPLERGMLWVGTDDGNIQITRDDGATWTNVIGNLRGVPAATWVPDIEPSKHAAGRAYAVFDDHRRGNWETYLYRTEDYGRSWTRMETRGVEGFAHVLAEDPVAEDLLFLGTEFGLWVSTDRGMTWEHWTSGVPAVPVRDALVHPRDGDLVLATHGRGVLILDDVRPLRALADGTVQADAGPVMIAPPPAWTVEIAEAIGYRSTGHVMQHGETRPNGALLSFWSASAGSARLEVADASGALVWSRSVAAHPGINRSAWNLRPGGDADEARFPRMVPVLPGSYTATVDMDGERSSAPFEVRADPRAPVDRADLVARNAALSEWVGMTGALSEAQARLQGTQEAVRAILASLAPEADDALRRQTTEVRDAVDATLRRLFTGPECQGICGGDTPASVVRGAGSALTELPGAPTPLARLRLEQGRAALDGILEAVNALLAERVAPLRDALRAAGYTPLADIAPIGRGR